MEIFEKVKTAITQEKSNYGHAQANKKNIQALEAAKIEIEEKLQKKNEEAKEKSC